MMSVKNDEKWNAASLHISSSSLSAEEITELLDKKPTKSYEKGTLLSKRNPKSQIRQDSLWILDSELHDSELLDWHIKQLVSFAEDKSAVFEQLSQKCNFLIFCGFASANGQGGFVLDSKLLAKMGKLKIDLVLDLYPEPYSNDTDS
jgi:hypothetical protein